jgi:hypothetical protein
MALQTPQPPSIALNINASTILSQFQMDVQYCHPFATPDMSRRVTKDEWEIYDPDGKDCRLLCRSHIFHRRNYESNQPEFRRKDARLNCDLLQITIQVPYDCLGLSDGGAG